MPEFINIIIIIILAKPEFENNIGSLNTFHIQESMSKEDILKEIILNTNKTLWIHSKYRKSEELNKSSHFMSTTEP